MQHSLFKKFISSFFAVAICALVLLGSVIIAFTGNYCLKREQTELRRSVIYASSSIAMSVSSSGEISYTLLKTIVDSSSNLIGGDMFITDTTGKILVCSEHDHYGTVPERYINDSLKGEMTFSGDMENFLEGNSLVVSVPVILRTGKTVAVVYGTLPLSMITVVVRDVALLFLVASFAVLLFLTFAAYLMTARLVHPLKEMAESARSISQGDFSHHITVDRNDELGELAESFNNMIKSLSASETMNRSFVANVSHELKTPMTSISGFIDGILDGTIPPEEHKKYLEIVSSEVKRLSRTVVSMLNLSRLESGEISLKPESVELSQMVLSIALGFEKKINEKDIEILGFDTLSPVVAYADRDLIYQAIYNLCENAIKYTPEKGYIEFRTSQQDGVSVLSIKNSGKGIPEKDLPHIFDRFYKVDKSRGVDHIGTGLGLYLVKTIISLHQGTITVKSAEDQYCEFIITLSGSPEFADNKKEN